MSDFSFIKNSVLPNEKSNKDIKYSSFKHHLFPLKVDEIEQVNSILPIPLELNDFFQKIGYGFFFQSDNSSIDRFVDVISFKKINLREDYYEFDPDLELYESYPDKLIFFEVNEGVYLLIDKEDNNGKNAIYYFDDKIADSLEEFLKRFDAEGHYFE